jgi:hypothetical protein
MLLTSPAQLEPRLAKYFPHRGDRGALRPEKKLSCSLIPELGKSVKELRAVGHVIYVRGFGVVRLAEFEASESRRRLTMISVDLGCPFEGTVGVCYTESNGSIWG